MDSQGGAHSGADQHSQLSTAGAAGAGSRSAISARVAAVGWPGHWRGGRPGAAGVPTSSGGKLPKIIPRPHSALRHSPRNRCGNTVLLMPSLSDRGTNTNGAAHAGAHHRLLVVIVHVRARSSGSSPCDPRSCSPRHSHVALFARNRRRKLKSIAETNCAASDAIAYKKDPESILSHNMAI